MQAQAGLTRMAEQREQLQGLLHASAGERDAALARGEAMLADLRELHARYEVRFLVCGFRAGCLIATWRVLNKRAHFVAASSLGVGRWVEKEVVQPRMALPESSRQGLSHVTWFPPRPERSLAPLRACKAPAACRMPHAGKNLRTSVLLSSEEPQVSGPVRVCRRCTRSMQTCRASWMRRARSATTCASAATP